MQYNIHEPWKTLDPWQKEYIETEGNCFLLCGRQSGKTAAASIKFGTRAATKKNRIIMMIAYTEKQAYNLFFKTLMFLKARFPRMLITRGRDKPTKHVINLKNGSKIMCHAAGLAGEGLRTYTLTDLVIDEAAPMAREVFVSCMPMLSVTGGSMDIISTPRGKEGFFYDCSKREDFKQFYVSAEDCPRHSKDFLDAQKSMMSELEYAQEYLARFLDDLKRVFPDHLIVKCCKLKRPNGIASKYDHYLGVDIARMGKDEGTFEIVRKLKNDKFQQVENIITKKKLTTETEQKIIELEKQYDFKEINLDAGAGTLGVSVLDHLLEEDSTKNKVFAINNRARSLDPNDTTKTKLFKEDLYNNLKRLMEKGEIMLLDDDEVAHSLASVQYEYVLAQGKPTKLRIFGNYTHVVEGLIRAAWGASQDKTLNIWMRWSSYGQTKENLFN
jgi:hypothetical protein